MRARLPFLIMCVKSPMFCFSRYEPLHTKRYALGNHKDIVSR